MTPPVDLIMLTQAERDRFAAYLEQEAHSDDGIAKQAETLDSMGAVIAKRYRTEAVAKIMVARMLRSIESQGVGS